MDIWGALALAVLALFIIWGFSKPWANEELKILVIITFVMLFGFLSITGKNPEQSVNTANAISGKINSGSNVMNKMSDELRSDTLKNCEIIKEKRGADTCGYEGALGALDQLKYFSESLK